MNDPKPPPSALPRSWQLPRMVRWFNVPQLARTGVSVVLSTLLGSMIDSRRIISHGGNGSSTASKECVFNYSDGPFDDQGGFWFDYMADTGDGWEATFSLAYVLSQPNAAVARVDQLLPRGTFLILGGDEVYPVASKDEYARRLVWPFNDAARALGQFTSPTGTLPKPDCARDLFAIPGNHDWYDGLDAFTRRLCSGRTLGSFWLRQRRSYFVLKLPFDWEIWCADLQLRHDIDVPQLEFFREHSRTISSRTRIILCSPEPDWVYGRPNQNDDLRFNLSRLRKLAEDQKAQVVIDLAGDTHNYQRYVETKPKAGGPRMKIVSGGGGAFLHPNHSFIEPRPGALPSKEPAFTCVERFPSEMISRKLSKGNLIFALKNPEMVVVLGILYFLMLYHVPVGKLGISGVVNFPFTSPLQTSLIVLLFLSLCRFADCSTPPRKALWGALHSACHLAVAWATWIMVPTWMYRLTPLVGGVDLSNWATAFGVITVGGFVGASVFGLYLFISLNWLRIHYNEAFSSLRIQDFKNFLRFRLDKDGLTMYAIGMPQLPAIDVAAATSGGQAQVFKSAISLTCIDKVRFDTAGDELIASNLEQ